MKRLFLFLILLLVPSLRVHAAPPVTLERTPLEETGLKCAGADDFCVTYGFGDREVKIDASSARTWFVTRASLERMRAETEEDAKPHSGKFLIDGREVSFPEEILLENGFVTDTEGRLIVSESAMYETLRQIFDRYNMRVEDDTTVFYATSGRAVFFGSEPEQIAEVDLEKEFAILKKAFLEQSFDLRREIHHEHVEQDIGAVGGDYIEVDAAEQMMYFYQDGEMRLSTPVVTGNLAAGDGTPAGIYPVINRARNAALINNHFANYWIGFTNRGHGIHDALWRNTFGGTIYKTAGSAGCVNTPLDMVEQFYDLAYPGLPVVVFY